MSMEMISCGQCGKPFEIWIPTGKRLSGYRRLGLSDPARWDLVVRCPRFLCSHRTGVMLEENPSRWEQLDYDEEDSDASTYPGQWDPSFGDLVPRRESANTSGFSLYELHMKEIAGYKKTRDEEVLWWYREIRGIKISK